MIRNAIASFLCVALMALPACINEALPPSDSTTNNGNPLPSGDDAINGGMFGNNDGAFNSEGGPVVIVNTDPLSQHAAQIQMPDGAIVDCWVKRDEAGNIEFVSHFRVISADAQVEHLQIDELGRPILFVDSLGFGFRVDEYLDDDQAMVTYFNPSGEEAQAMVDLGTSQGNGLATNQSRPLAPKALNQDAARWPSDAACEALHAGVSSACLTLDIMSAIKSSACVLAIVVDIITVPSGEGLVACVWLNSIGESLIISMLCGISEFAVDDVCRRARRGSLGEPSPPVPLPCVGMFTDSQGDICDGWATIIVEHSDNWYSSTWLTIDNLCASSTWLSDDTLLLTGHAWGGTGQTRPVACVNFQLQFEIELQLDVRASRIMCSASPYYIPLPRRADGWISLAYTEYDLFGNVFEDYALWSSPPSLGEGPLSANVLIHCDTGELKLLNLLPSIETTTDEHGRASVQHFQLGSW